MKGCGLCSATAPCLDISALNKLILKSGCWVPSIEMLTWTFPFWSASAKVSNIARIFVSTFIVYQEYWLVSFPKLYSYLRWFYGPDSSPRLKIWEANNQHTLHLGDICDNIPQYVYLQFKFKYLLGLKTLIFILFFLTIQ